MTDSRLVHTLYLLLAAVVALSFGFSYGNVGNQETYLPHALHYVDPRFLGNDWLVHETTVYHGSFRWVVAALAGLGSVAWGAALLHVALVAASLYALYLIVTALAPELALWAMAVTMLCMVIDQTGSVGASFLFSEGLQPATLATTAWLFSIWAFVRRQYGLSGCILALGGLFHTNFLVLGIGLFALAHLLLRNEKLLRRLLVQIGPSLTVLAFSLPMILAATGGEGAQQARDIFMLIRSPHHYVPLTYLTQFFYLGGWFLCAVGALLAMPASSLRRPMLALFAAFGISLAGATLLTTVIFVPQVAQLFVWRLAPFLLVISQLIVAIFLVSRLRAGAGELRHVRAAACAGILGTLMILRWVVYSAGLSLQLGVAAVAIGVYLALWISQKKTGDKAGRNAPALLGCCVIAATLVLAMARMPGVIEKSTLFHDPSLGLHAWAQRSSEKAVFLVPVEMGDFRLLAKRPVVVDWKSTPIKPDELIEWYSRIQTVAGRPVRSRDDAVSGYRSHDLEQLRKIAAGFGADYIVVTNDKQNLANQRELPVFSNKKFSVFPASAQATPDQQLGERQTAWPGAALTTSAR